MAHDNFQERREFVERLARYGIRFNSTLIEDLARAFGCSTRAIRVDIHVVGSRFAQSTALRRGAT
jgi:hypothetical protein